MFFVFGVLRVLRVLRVFLHREWLNGSMAREFGLFFLRQEASVCIYCEKEKKIEKWIGRKVGEIWKKLCDFLFLR